MNRLQKLAADIVSLFVVTAALWLIGVVILIGLFILYVVLVVMF